MRYMNNNKSETKRIFRSNKNFWQRAISFITVFSLVVNTMYSRELFGLFNFSAVMTVSAEDEIPAYVPSNPVSEFSGNEQVFADGEAGFKKFVDYCHYYSVNEGGTFCAAHREDTLKINISALPDNYSFMGLGNADVPFAGKVAFISSGGKSNISLPRALFTHVSTDARITDNSDNDITLEITRNSSESSPILADFVHPGEAASNWSVEVASGNKNAFAGAIGRIAEDANVVLTFKNASSAVVSNTASGENDIKDVGELCGVMETGSRLTVTDNTTNRTAVSSANGNAGSLVGTMEGTAALTLSGYPVLSSVSVTSDNGYAGGLVGDMGSASAIVFAGLSTQLDVGGSVTGKNGAGGLYGHYTNNADEFDLKDYNITAAVSADNCGGVFGVLENIKGTSEAAASLTIKNTNKAGTVNVISGSSASSGYFGGLIGKYTTDDLRNSLIIDDVTLSATSNASFNSFGGAIGIVDSAAYIKADDLAITSKGTAKRDSSAYFGGLIGKTTETNGVFIDLGDITLSADSSGFKGGGIVGDFEKGVLRLSGITDMSSAKSQKGGQLVGENESVLIYAIGDGTDGVSSVRNTANEITAAASGWTFKRSDGSQVDDLGTWGEVVRISGIESILTVDSSNHTVTVPAAVTSISSASDFVKTALNIQLNQGENYDCLLFTAGDRNKRENLLKNTSLTIGTVSLSGTGITGFMRDGGDTVGSFTGTLTGSGTVTLAVGEKYGKTSANAVIAPSTTGEGLGQIYRHPYNGLFSVIGEGTTGTGTVKSLTIDGAVNVRNKIDGMNIGGIAAVSEGNTTLNGITANQTVNYGESPSVTGTESKGKNIGGLIGLANETDNGTIAITGTNVINTTFNISDNFKDWSCLGAFIGKVTSPKFTVNIATNSGDSLTVSDTMSGSFTAGSNADGGGLIGYITSGDYSNRKVNIKNLTFNNCTIVNKASENAGGFLGYAWLGTDTTIDGITVTDGTITNTTPNVGVMCYVATGRWKVNDLTVAKMNLSGGAGTSLGMLVNKMYTTDTSGNVNGALYLDVLNAGYKLGGSNIALPQAIGLYDEIAVYSAPDVLEGGAGVISINMNSSRNTGSAKITDTGTYQNKLAATSSEGLTSEKYANAHSRYYYNLDRMSTSNAGQNLVLWSVGKYAYSDITSALPATTLTDSNLTGNTDLTGLSYYPLAKAGEYTLNGLNVRFDYNGIYDTAEATFQTGITSDGYVRDPGAAGNNKNQHYLMHGGLFIDLTAGNTITVSGKSSIGGTFLEVDGYKAALISGTMYGNLNISGGLDLNGLIPKTTGNALYTDGYLMINSISRPDTQTQNVSVNISGLTVSGYASAALPVAKSLIGAADGRGFMFDLSGIKLDGRKADIADNEVNSALTTAYGTSRSLFSDAILFYSINTDRYAEMTYNFEYAQDWGTENESPAPRNVTYGNEISHTVEYWDTEGNKSRQSKYSGTKKNFTNPTGSKEEYDFQTTVFLPYVHESYSNEADHSVKYYRELKVNYLLEIESKGCGTYNDPYIIESPDQLIAIAAFIKSGNKNSINLSSITLPKYNGTNFNGIAANTSGARWCTDKDGSGYHVDYSAKDGGGFEAANCTDWSDENARYYLANAYYKIANNITLDSKFAGLGGIEANYAFRGVIVGETDEQGVPKYSITNKSTNPFINVSNGCVVKDVNIVVNYASGIQIRQDNNSSTKAYFGYDYASNDTCNFYGGMIGEIMGGDNIIDNSYVKYSNTSITLTGSSATIVPVGGYVGVVVFGGLIFKNISAAKTTISQTGLRVSKSDQSYNLADNSGEEAWAAIYVNPLVGRVINGYAVNETGGNALDADGEKVQQFSVTEDGRYHDEGRNARSAATVQHTLKNGAKHYSIADIDPYYGNTAEQWKALTDAEKNAFMLDVTPPVNTTTDGTINVPNSQAMFILSLITQSTSGTAQTADGDYLNSLSYGINSSSVYGMSHNADYTNVGSATADTDTDYVSACDDTAANTAVPYIIRKYTVKTEDSVAYRDVEVQKTRTVTKYRTEYVDAIREATANKNAGELYTYDGEGLDGIGVYLYIDRGGYTYVTNGDTPDESNNNFNPRIRSSKNRDEAAVYYFELVDTNDYYLYTVVEGQRKYVYNTNPTGGGGNSDGYLNFTTNQADASIFTVARYKNNNTNRYKVYIKAKNWGLNKFQNNSGRGIALYNADDDGSKKVIEFAENTSITYNEHYQKAVEVPYEDTETYTDIEQQPYTVYGGYPARCVTSTKGYYDINLTGSNYVLPDSFRGLGSVGYRDDVTNGDNVFDGDGFTGNTQLRYNNRYCMKIDTFDGKNKAIDQDIYLNKFENDNYFNAIRDSSTANQNVQTVNAKGYTLDKECGLHGVGLFDSIVMKKSDSVLKDFTLSGSVNTEIYSNSYKTAKDEQELKGSGGVATRAWYTSGGVVGWTLNGTRLKFSQIALNGLSIRGTSGIGGLLGYSNNTTKTVFVIVDRCSADNISLDLASGFNDTTNRRCAAGAFVGKIREGGVYVYGTANEDQNTDTSQYKEVVISGFKSYEHWTVNLGGLVGYAGNGCQVYDMHVRSSSGADITIGNATIGIAGGLVGLMQPQGQADTTCNAKFVNCNVQNINIAAFDYAGGLYGGTHNDGWSPYTIAVRNCQMIGNETANNTIAAYGKYEKKNDGYKGFAGGLVADGFVVSSSENSYNIEIADSKVSHYTITSSQTNTSSGGFIGYANARGSNSVTCYIHDSSVENCTLGASGKYAGGAIGEVAQNTENKILGYNIKLDTITDGTKNGSDSYIGAWIGKATADGGGKTTKIQFTGLAIYGNGFTKNVGNNVTLSNASFVFSAYDEDMLAENPGVSELNKGTVVDMPKYPYVNINPQSSMGIDEYITGDGAVLLSTASTDENYKGKTAEKTLALKIYEDIKAGADSKNYSRRYSTYDDKEINDANTISEYMKRTTLDDGDRISNYYDEKGITSLDAPGYDNFACIVIANNNDNETTDLINRYVQLVTNTTTDYVGTDANNDYFDIDISTCKLDKNVGKFVVDSTRSSTEHGLSYSGRKLNLNGIYADSQSADDSFTLVDVQFKDPLDNSRIAYHLYVPVYTIKEIEVKFSAAVMNGTNSVSYNGETGAVSNGYLTKLNTSTSDTHVDNLNTWFTSYIRYTYSYEDLKALLDSGNLNWNHKKIFYIDKYTNNAVSMLPDNTYMILVDPNGNHDKKYQVTLNSTDFAVDNNRISFDFEKFKDSSDNTFRVSTFNELIAQKIKAEENISINGKYDEYSGEGTPSNTGDDHYVYIKAEDGTPTYYQYVGSGGKYDLTIPDEDIYEDYYISMYVPGAESDSRLYGYYIRTPESFSAPTYESGTNNAVTKSAKVNCVYAGTDMNGENTINRQVYIGNVFDQTTELNVLPNDLEIDGGNHTLNIFAKTTITPKNNDVFSILSGINPDIYHSFNIFLDTKGENNVITNKISGLVHDLSDPENINTGIHAWYSIDQPIPLNENTNMQGFTEINASSIDLDDNYINVVTVNGGKTIMKKDGVTIYSRIELDFDDYESEFPQKVASDTGVSVRASSNLAYDPLSLVFSNTSEPIAEPASSKHVYYRQSLSTANLKYYAATEQDSFDIDGLPSENYSRLGVSGKYSMNNYMPVNTIAQYNVQNIESALGDAEHLDITLSLQKKTDDPHGSAPYTSASYQNVSNLNNYWGAVIRDENKEVKPDLNGKPETDSGTNLRIKCGTYDRVVNIPENSKTFTVSIPKEDLTNGINGFVVDENGYIYIDIGFNAKTGDGFKEYANYKVNLSVKLAGAEGDITGSYADDYLVYTNAKVNHDFLKNGGN